MAQYTNLNEQAISEILSAYGLMYTGVYKVLSGGSANTNYKVATDKGEIVLTVCEQKSLEEADQLATLLDYLNQQGFATSKPLRTLNGALTMTYRQKSIMLKSFIHGSIIKDLPNEMMIKLGGDLARLHQIPALEYVPTQLNYGIEHFVEVSDYAPDSSFHQWIKKVSAYIEGHFSADLPKALIHSDVFYNNIIVSENGQEAQIMDFEEACNYYRVYDIGMMIVGVCSEGERLKQDKVASLLKGYQQVTLLQPLEKSTLQAFTVYAAAATAFWRHQQFNHFKPDPAMADHYKAMQDLANAVWAIPNVDFFRLLE